jgi:caa(3)-type oxidase subunit IV
MDAEQKPIVFEHEHAPPNSAATSIGVFLFLGALTFLALVIGFADLGGMKIYASLAVALTQACVLAFFSMELKNQGTLIWLTAAAGVFWTFLLFLFTLTDYITRGWSAY